MADDDDRTIKTVKGVSAAAWEKGLIAAKKRGEPFGLWLGRGIERQADVEADDRVILPDEKGRPEPGLPASAPAVSPVSLAEIELAMRAAKAVADASGVPVPKTTARHCFAILTKQLRAARGLPALAPRQTRRRIGQTRPQIGQTVDG